MKALPSALKSYKRTPVFSETTIPKGLLRAHHTKRGTWGKIVVETGSLLYRILEPTVEEITLSPQLAGVVEPEQLHEVEPLGTVAFYVEFFQ